MPGRRALTLAWSNEPTRSAEGSGGTPASLDQALELLRPMLDAGVVSAPVLLELAYYAELAAHSSRIGRRGPYPSVVRRGLPTGKAARTLLCADHQQSNLSNAAAGAT